MSCYSNSGFTARGPPRPGDRANSNSRLEVQTFQAYNQTFVGDNGEQQPGILSCPDGLYLEYNHQPLERRRSIASPNNRIVGYHRPYRYESARRSLGFEDSDGDYVDTPEERLGLRQSPLGSSGSFRPSELRTPSKRDRVILAPMIADAERVRREMIIRTPIKCIPQHHQLSPVHRLRSPQGRLPSFSEPRTPTRRPPNMAVITPNFRGSTAPLLTRSPPRQSTPEVYKSRVSWANLPTIHLPTELLCCVGFTLLSSGAASIILSFYILAVGGRKYFLNFGAVAGFTSLVLGMLSCRTNKWKWLPHRNYLTGYILLSTFSLLETACLGGIIYALTEGSYALLDTLGGAVCALSILVIIGSITGMVTSGCCHRPPPDNRVAHSVAGFTV